DMRRIFPSVVAGAIGNVNRGHGSGPGDAMQLRHQAKRVSDMFDDMRQKKSADAALGERQRLLATALQIRDDVDAGAGDAIDIDPAARGLLPQPRLSRGVSAEKPA